MTLFDIKDIEVNQPATKSKKKVKLTTKEKAVLGTRYDTCANVIGHIDKDCAMHYVSMGEWSMHDLTIHLLQQTGPAKVTIATWSISPVGCQHLMNACEEGLITELYGLFDWRIKVRNPEAHQLARFNMNDIRLFNCHAKTTIIQNEEWNISIVGSANYTGNPRVECGVITESKEIATFHQQWIADTISKADPFES